MTPQQERIEILEELLEDVATSGVTFSDPRLSYVEIQMDAHLWETIQKMFGQE